MSIQGSFPSSCKGKLASVAFPLERLAVRAGTTAFFSYDRTLLSRCTGEPKSLLPPAVDLHYAIKASSMPALACHVASLADGMEISSPGELEIAQTGYPVIVFQSGTYREFLISNTCFSATIGG